MLFKYEYILKMEGISIRYALFVLVILATFTESKITKLNVVEGDVAFLNFSYSCNSTEVTLQHGHRSPFYNSSSPTSLSSSNLKLRNETDGKVCFLYLTINPVTRDDAGGYILTAYNNGPMLFEDDRVLLLVGYPPGKASCSLSEEHIDPDWVRLQCTAPIGNIGGFIMCYQNGIEIAPLSPPQENDETLSQTMLAKVGDLVYCCSSALDQTKDKCDCKDSVWDPIQNKQVTNISDPCPPTVTTVQNPPFSLQPIEDNGYELTSPSTKTITGSPPQIHSRKANAALIAFICLLILVIVILVATCILYGKKQQRKPANCKKENGVLESCISECPVERV